MKTYNVTALYQTTQGPGTSPNNTIWVEGVAVKIEPNAGSFYGPRTLILGNASQEVQKMSGNGWIQQRFTSFQFACELFGQGSNASDSWVVSIAEPMDDPNSYAGGGTGWSANYSYSSATGLYTNNGGTTGVQNVNIASSGTELATKQVIATVSASTNGTATTGTNISSLINPGNLLGFVVSNTGTTGTLNVSVGVAANVIAQLLPNTSSGFFQISPASLAIIVSSLTSATYSATGFGG